ncbi:GtrA family protein [Corynebacterium camporealensis]
MSPKFNDAAGRLSRSDSLRAQSTKFAITGVISAIVDVSITWIMQLGLGILDKNGARATGFIVGTTVAYLLNRRWTFHAQASKRRFAAVALTYGVTFAVNMLMYNRLFDFFDDRWGWDSNISLVLAFIIAQGTATVANFLVQRWIIFRKKGKKKTKIIDQGEPA